MRRVFIQFYGNKPDSYDIIVFVPCNCTDKLTYPDPECIEDLDKYGKECDPNNPTKNECGEDTPKLCGYQSIHGLSTYICLHYPCFNLQTSSDFFKMTGVPISFLNVNLSTDYETVLETEEKVVSLLYSSCNTFDKDLTKETKKSIKSITYDFKPEEANPNVAAWTYKDGSITFYPSSVAIFGFGGIHTVSSVFFLHEAAHAYDFKLRNLADQSWMDIAKKGFPIGYDYWFLRELVKPISKPTEPTKQWLYFDGLEGSDYGLTHPYGGMDFMEDRANVVGFTIQGNPIGRDYGMLILKFNGKYVHSYGKVYEEKLNWLCEKKFIPLNRCLCVKPN